MVANDKEKDEEDDEENNPVEKNRNT